MKKIIVLILVLTMGVVSAEVVSPLQFVKPSLDEMLLSSPARKDLAEMKAVANERNTEVGGAVENYIIAKKNVSVARAQFNPITTGYILGIGMGINFLWAPLAIDAVLSIPTKIHNVKKNKHIATAALYNLYDVRQAINNELARLYYDILTHEVILKTIDLEMDVLKYQEANWIKKQYSPIRLADQRKYILRLGMERVDIYKLYLAELAAIRTLISTTDTGAYELSQVPTEINKSVFNGLELESLQKFSLKNSNKYKSSASLSRAAQSNVKQVRWSIISLSGLRLSYRRNLKAAKNEARIASLRQQSVALEVKTNVLLQASKLDSNIDVFENYNYVSNSSLELFEDTLHAQELGLINEDSVVETAIGAIRDYRSKVVAHYVTWSSLDDFSTSSNYDFKITPNYEAGVLQGQIESNPLYKLDEETFYVKIKNTDNLTVYLSSPKIGDVSKVEYEFDEQVLGTKFSDDGRSNYGVTISGKNIPQTITGVANVTMDNGHEFQVKFSLTK